MRFLIPILVAFSLLGHCGTMSRIPIKVEDVQMIKEGVTTRDVIVNVYGEPQKTGLSGDLLNYCYWHKEFLNPRDNLLFLQFDVGGVVTRKNLNDKTAQEECGSVVPASPSPGMNSSGASGGNSGVNRSQNNSRGNCHIYDGTDQYGRPIYRCP